MGFCKNTVKNAKMTGAQPARRQKEDFEVFDSIRETVLARRSVSGVTVVFAGLLIISLTILSCGGSDDDNGGDNGPAIFSPTVFMADKETAGTVELFASSDDGTDIIKLSGNLVAGGDVVDFKVSPNGILAAYVADQSTDQVFELYVVPVDKAAGESAVKISGFFMAGNGIEELSPGEYAFAWAPDSSWIAYLADQRIAGVVELFSNQHDGNSATTRRLSNLPTLEFKWAPDSSLIAYKAGPTVNDGVNLYTTTVDQLFSQQITSGLPPGRQASEFAWSPVVIPPDTFRIAFIADKTSQGLFQLWTTSPNDSNNVLVSGNLILSSEVVTFAWAPDSSRISYIADDEEDEVFALFTTLPAAPGITKISGDLVNGGDVAEFAWAPDSSRIAFIADRLSNDIFELFTNLPSAGDLVKISADLTNDGDVIEFAWAPDSSLIAYAADQDTDGKFELYTSPPDSDTGNSKVSGTPMAGSGVADFSWAPDSSRLAYIADQNTADVFELFAATPDGSVNDLVSGPQAAGGNVEEAEWAPDSSGIGYIADQESDEVFELFASQPDGSDNTNLSGNLVAGGDVSAFEWVP